MTPPAWALEGSATPPTPPPRPPARDDIVLWFAGDYQLESVDGEMTSWTDRGLAGLDATVFGSNITAPAVGEDSIDGIPCISGGMLSTSDHGCGNTGAPWGVGASRTVMAMVRPAYSADGFGLTGGGVFTSMDTGSTFPWQTRFELADNFAPNQYGVLGSTGFWNLGPSTTGGAGGPFNGVPTLCMWQSTNSATNIVAQRNGGSNLAISPTTPINIGGTINTGFRLLVGSDGGRNFYGSLAELIAWQKILTAEEQAAANLYFATRYPSAPIVLV